MSEMALKKKKKRSQTSITVNIILYNTPFTLVLTTMLVLPPAVQSENYFLQFQFFNYPVHRKDLVANSFSEVRI